MLTSLSILPLAFWVVIAVLICGGIWAAGRLRDGSGLPMLAVLATIAFWYVGDAYYNDYAENHAKTFNPATLQSAWWQVAWFLVVFLFAAPRVHRWFNARSLHAESGVLRMFKHGVDQPLFQKQLSFLFKGCFLIWVVLDIVAALRVKGDVIYYFFPFWGQKAEPWGRGQLGTGFDSLITVAFYFQMLVTATFGVVAALATDRRVRSLAVLCCLLSWPSFVFDRTRNSMLAVVVPGILSWGTLRLRGSLIKRAAALGACFLVINVWMKFVITNRSSMSIAAAIKQKGLDLGSTEKARHEGLNMYEELCWINTFMQDGSYPPNWGARYLADLVNPIPRVIWPGKPMRGFDYAVLRGQKILGDQGQVTATLSTGLIGQGVVNFGRFLGPVAAALIMGFWAAILARLDLGLHRIGRLPLYATGLFVTFNVGRDFCFLALYPFVFGAVLIWFLDRHLRKTESPATGALPAGSQLAPCGTSVARAPASGAAAAGPARPRFGRAGWRFPSPIGWRHWQTPSRYSARPGLPPGSLPRSRR